jgi:cell wall assembly regulator SMI1
MQDVWQRIEAQFRLQAPSRLSQLAKGASQEQIDHLERLVGRPLPGDIRQSYAIHDGAYGLPFAGVFDYLLSLEDIASHLATWRETLDLDDPYRAEPNPVGPVKHVWWSMGWVPIVGEGTGDHLCIDLDPAEGGTVGQVFDFAHEYGPTEVLFPSFRAYLERYAASLESGAIRYDPEDMHWVNADGPSA